MAKRKIDPRRSLWVVEAYVGHRWYALGYPVFDTRAEARAWIAEMHFPGGTTRRTLRYTPNE